MLMLWSVYLFSRLNLAPQPGIADVSFLIKPSLPKTKIHLPKQRIPGVEDNDPVSGLSRLSFSVLSVFRVHFASSFIWILDMLVFWYPFCSSVGRMSYFYLASYFLSYQFIPH